MTTFCAYCRRQHRPEVTQCDGCGAPKTRQSVPSVYLTSDVIDVTHLRTLGATKGGARVSAWALRAKEHRGAFVNRRSFFGTLLAAPVAVKAALKRKPFGKFGRWFRAFGAGAPTVLHGSEVVLTESQLAAFKAAWEAENVNPTRLPLREGQRR